MNREEILDIFYNHIVPEAFNGRVDCYFMYNTYFYTKVPSNGIELISNEENTDLMIPTLYVTNYELFNDLLVEYVKKAIEFYDDSNYPEEILNGIGIEQNKGISKEKVIMTLLWSNATVNDYQDPCNFLRKRINYFKLGNLEDYRISKIIGYSEILDSNIECVIEKARIESETPYYFKSYLISPDNGERIYEFPRIYFGISDGGVDVYAIQNGKNKILNEKIARKIDRKLYKVNDGIDIKNDIYDNYGVGNLKDITPSFLVVANIFSGLLKINNYNKLNIISILISRWNAKIKAIDMKKILLLKKNIGTSEIDKLIEEYYDKNLRIQANLTEKFLRIFRRLGYHHSSIGVISYPMELDNNLGISIYDDEDICNNKLLEETFRINNSKLLKR